MARFVRKPGPRWALFEIYTGSKLLDRYLGDVTGAETPGEAALTYHRTIPPQGGEPVLVAVVDMSGGIHIWLQGRTRQPLTAGIYRVGGGLPSEWVRDLVLDPVAASAEWQRQRAEDRRWLVEYEARQAEDAAGRRNREQGTGPGGTMLNTYQQGGFYPQP